MNAEIFNNMLNEKRISLIYFSYPECGVCKSLLPKIEELVKKYNDVYYSYINTHENVEFCAQNNILSVPTLLIFTEAKENRRWIRSFSVSEIDSYLQRLINLMH